MHILDATTGKYVGSLMPSNAVGAEGNVDTPLAINVFERANGEYEIMVEDDGLAKQVLYRWNPLGPVAPANTAPTITAQPVSQTVLLGQAATFNVVGFGSQALSYQWRKNGVTISGATFASYTTPTTTSGYNGALYSVKITNSSGQVISSGATLTVVNPSNTIVQTVSDLTGITQTGSWAQSTHDLGFRGSYYLTDGNAGGGSSVTFTPNLPTAQSYQVFAWWTADTNRATNVPITVNNANGTATVVVNEQTSNDQWVSLGTYSFNSGTGGSVTISDSGANGFVIANAVCFVPVANVVVDVSNSSGTSGTTTKAGSWTQSTGTTEYGSYYLQDGNAGGGKSVTFTPSLGVSGNYEVFVWSTAYGNRAASVPVSIVTSDGTVSPSPINQMVNGGQWVSVGTYSFNSGTTGSITISDTGAQGYVVTDAVQFEQRL